MDALSGSRIGNSLSEALGLSSPSAERVAQQQWQQIDAGGDRGSGASATQPAGGQGAATLSAPRLAAAERAGEAGELHPRGRFLNLKI